MALSMHGGRSLHVDDAPDAATADSFTFSPAAPEDAPFLEETVLPAGDRYLVTCPRDRTLWESQLTAHDSGSAAARTIAVIERGGAQVGALGWFPTSSDGTFWATLAELNAGTSWGEAGPAVLRRLAEQARADGAHQIRLALGEHHPLFDAMWHLLGDPVRPYAWYLRAADVPALLRHLSPVLEWRLNDGPFEAHTGSTRISWYTGGVRLVLDGGLLDVADWTPGDDDRGDLSFPGTTFLSLVFGHRSLRDLRSSYPDCVYGTPAAAPLVDALFPCRPSWVWQVV
jgi:hypothetical protein